MIDNSTTSRRHNLLVIKASAGSGKTYTLAKQYIQYLLFSNPEGSDRLLPRRGPGEKRLLNTHRQLLAITFTNKATDEMKQRIVSELYKLSRSGVKSDYLGDFMKASGLDEDSVRALARQALNELLFDYSNFNVSTIDSFFQTILRNFARELDRDFNYDIQLEEDYAVKVAVHNFLLSLGKKGKPTQVDLWVKEYQRHLIRGDAEKKNWKFFDDGGELNKFAKQINSELFRSRMDEIRNYLGNMQDGTFHPDFSRIREFKKMMHDVVGQCEALVEQGLQVLKQALEPQYDALSGNKSFKKWLNKGGDTPLTAALENAGHDTIASQFLGKAQPSTDVVERLLTLVNNHFLHRNMTAFFKHIENNLGLLGMLAMIDIFLEEYRHESNSILIGDTNELIGTVLESGSDFVYERVGTSIAHFMIDEFQDTSAKQYENFRGLLRESLANGYFNMLIGDAKQSIYRFRNADPTVFRERVGNDFAGDITMGRRPADEGKPSSTNYRSSRNIIDFNNRLFEYLRDVKQGFPAVVATYNDVEQGMPPDIDEKKVPGYVRLMLGNYKHLLNDQAVRQTLPEAEQTGGGGNDDVDVLTVLPGYLLKLHERFDWGRMGILVNKHRQGDKVVECILNYNKRAAAGAKINIISGESLLLNNSPVIRRIIAMLRFIDISQFAASEDDADDAAAGEGPADDVAQRLRLKRLSDRRLYTALNGFIKEVAARPDASPLDNGELLTRCLEEAADVDASQSSSGQTMRQLMPPSGELTTLVSIVENIITHFKMDEASSADVDRETAFLLAFQDAVMQFSSMRNGGSVREFLKYWDEKKGSLAVNSPATGDAINIMTIHSAKGLEFDCVIIPYADWEIDNNSRERYYWMPREAFADTLRSLGMDGKAGNQDVIPPLLHIDKASVKALNDLKVLHDSAREFVDKQVTDVLIDNLNKTYVAMTRPRTELHIFASGNAGTVAPLLDGFARGGGLMTPVIGADDWFETGQPATRGQMDEMRLKGNKGDGEDKPLQLPLNSYPVNDIPVQLKVRVDHASGRNIKAGRRLHSLLSRIVDRDDVDGVIAMGIKHGVITDDADDPCGLHNIDVHVRRPIMDPSSPVAAWFDPDNRIYSERTITSLSDDEDNPDGIDNLRPDRIIRRPDGSILVIDYKSGQRDDKKNLRQLRGYIDKLHLIFPGASIAGRLWYVSHDLILDHDGHKLN